MLNDEAFLLDDRHGGRGLGICTVEHGVALRNSV
jgi:hypothetical protein